MDVGKNNTFRVISKGNYVEFGMCKSLNGKLNYHISGEIMIFKEVVID